VPTWFEEKPEEKGTTLEESGTEAGIKRKQVWHPKDKPNESGRSAPACMVCFLPNEFMAPANQIV
jgi:hypothetical protein